jgi:hypothetical protein
LKETPYIGVLFIVAAVALTVVDISLLRRRTHTAGWVVGALARAGTFLGVILSRIVGLPDSDETWTSDNGLGLMSLQPKLIFIAAAFNAVRVRRPPQLRVHEVSALTIGQRKHAVLARNNARRYRS